jgi:hypothetical protein
VFSGETGTVGAENIAAELKVSPAHASLRMRLMSVFCRSIAAANAFLHTLQCIFGCIYGIPLYFFLSNSSYSLRYLIVAFKKTLLLAV